ncbi:MAG: four helix bundle protein [Gemmatimonadales bacterium]
MPAFEELLVWRRAREMVSELYRMTGAGRLERDWGLHNQMQRAAVSVISNVAEGFERGRRGELRHFLSIAKGSCGELRSQLYVALDVGYIGKDDFTRMHSRLLEISRLLDRFRAAVIRQQEADSARQE